MKYSKKSKIPPVGRGQICRNGGEGKFAGHPIYKYQLVPKASPYNIAVKKAFFIPGCCTIATLLHHCHITAPKPPYCSIATLLLVFFKVSTQYVLSRERNLNYFFRKFPSSMFCEEKGEGKQRFLDNISILFHVIRLFSP